MSSAASDRRLAEVVERSLDLICIVDADGRIEDVNPAVQRLLGWSRDEVAGRFMLNFVHPEDVQSVTAAYGFATPARPDVELVHRFRARDRSWRWLEVRAVIRFGSTGALEAIELVARDVTERKAGDRGLHRSAARLETLVAAATDGILMENADRRITVASQAFCSLFAIGAHPDALVGSDARDALAAVSDLPGADAKVEAGRPIRGELLRLADGRVIARDYVPIGAAAGEGHLWIFRDVTTAQRAEAELRDARDAAVAAGIAKSDFIATMSHEIRTPLSGIAGAAALLLDAGLPEPEQELAAIVAEAAESLGDVLDVSRIEAGRVELSRSDYDPRRLLGAVAGILRPTLAGRSLALDVAVAASVPAFLRGDAARIRQIVLNLAGNAVKYTEHGQVQVAAEAADGRLRIAVSDTGPGISTELLARLFDPWTRGHGREWAGTGLGLGIARRLARAMNGDVTAVSTPGSGSIFTLELPLIEGAPVRSETSATTPDPVGARVLVAEDNRALRMLLGRQLARLGVQSTLVENGEAAVAAAQEHAFDAVLLDLRMPVLGGLEAARRIRAGETHTRVRILALTADTAEDDVAQCLAAGMDGHLAKPVSLETLRAAIGSAATVATVAPAPEGAPVLDAAQLSELADGLGGAPALDGVLTVYRDDLREQLRSLRSAVEGREPGAIRTEAHALRSAAAAFGAVRLAQLARGLEDAAGRGESDVGPEVLARIAGVVDETDAELARRLGR